MRPPKPRNAQTLALVSTKAKRPNRNYSHLGGIHEMNVPPAAL